MPSQSLILTDHQKEMLKAALNWSFSDNFPRFVLYNKNGELFEKCKGNTPVSYLYIELKEAFLKNPEAELGVLLGGAPWQTICVDPSGENQFKKMVESDFFDSVFYYKKCSKKENETIQTYYFVENMNSNFFKAVELFSGCRVMGFNETLPFAFSFFEDFYISTEKNKKVMPFPQELLKLKEKIEEKNMEFIFTIEKETGIDITKNDEVDLAELFFGNDQDIIDSPEEKQERQIPNPLYFPEKVLDNSDFSSAESVDSVDDIKSLLSHLAKEVNEKKDSLPEPELDVSLQKRFVKKPSLPAMVYPENSPQNIDAAHLFEQKLWEKMFFLTLLNGMAFQKILGERLEMAISPTEMARHTGLKIETLYADMQHFGTLYPKEAERMLKMLSPAESGVADEKLKDILSVCRSSLLAGINTPPRPDKIRTAERKSVRIF